MNNHTTFEENENLSYINVNGVILAYTKKGVGAPLIFLHGNGEDHTIFEETVELLKPYYTCYCIDTRGHGKSSEIKEYHYQDMADDVDAMIRVLDLKNVSVCGFSDGGIIGLLLAMQNPEIRNLVACGANIHPMGVRLSVLAKMRLENARHKNPMVTMMMEEPDISVEQLGAITAKTLIAAGENDLIRYRHTKKIADSIPSAQMRIIRGEDHGSYIVHSEKLGRLLLKWYQIR